MSAGGGRGGLGCVDNGLLGSRHRYHGSSNSVDQSSGRKCSIVLPTMKCKLILVVEVVLGSGTNYLLKFFC